MNVVHGSLYLMLTSYTVMLPQSNEANRQVLKKSLNCLALLKTHATGTRITCVIINKMQISMHL